MLRFVDTAVQEIETYREFASPGQVERVRDFAKTLQNARILHLNATPYGGGVAEMLNSLVALEKGLGLDVSWAVVVAQPAFFAFTKRLHNALQGDPVFHVSDEEHHAYLAHNQAAADAINGRYDIIVVHDPQPAAARHLAGKAADGAWIWRVHIDLSEYNHEAWCYLSPYVHEYDAFVFTLPEFVPEPLDKLRVHCYPPAIDPLSPKNLALPLEIRYPIVRWLGVDRRRPLLTQVSRFDPWKDPLGVIRVYRELRKKHPDLQLALLGSMALDDPEGWSIYQQILDDVDSDPEIHVASNFTGISNIEVNAFQSASDVVIGIRARRLGDVVEGHAGRRGQHRGHPVADGRRGGRVPGLTRG
jgi:trehalose synthase